jgi:hypothetical protein
MVRLVPACLALLLVSQPAAARSSQRPPSSQPPPSGQPSESTPPAGATSGAPATGAADASTPPPDAAQLLVFGSDVGIIINPIKTDKAADFEAILARVRQALEQSTNPVRRQQAASWKVLKAAEPGPAGSILYVFLMQPPVRNADYTLSRILAEGYPTEVDALWASLRDAYAAPMHRLTLETVEPSGTAAAAVR